MYKKLSNNFVEHYFSTVNDFLNISRSTLNTGLNLAAPKTQNAPLHKVHRLIDLFYKSESEHSNNTAIISPDDSQINYHALRESVESLASQLYKAGIREKTVVAFIAERSFRFVECILALSRLGATFAACDKDYPPSRLQEQIECIDADYLICSSEIDNTQFKTICPDGTKFIEYSEGCSDHKLDNPPKPTPASCEDLAYILFTSGTTGKPKAIGVGHNALISFIDWQSREFNIGSSDSVTMLSGLSHDPVMRDIMLPLSKGATLLIPDEKYLRDPTVLTSWILESEPTVIHTTPSMGKLLQFVWNPVPFIPSLRYIFWGGDKLSTSIISDFSQNNKNLVQVNFYGATETPQAALYHICNAETQECSVAPIGKTTPNYSVTIGRNDCENLYINEIGSLRLYSNNRVVRLGEHNDSEAQDIGQCYNTGDLGYYLPNGEVMLIGRQDDQVKIRGYRIELADITQSLNKVVGILESVILVESNNEQKQLVAHVSIGQLLDNINEEDFITSLKSELRKSLPGYMIPARFILHKSIPLNPNGKIDKKRLKEKQNFLEKKTVTTKNEKISGKEALIIQIYEKHLGIEIHDTSQSLSALGADSLNSIQIMLKLEGIVDELPENWVDLSINKLSHHVSSDQIASSKQNSGSWFARGLKINTMDLSSCYRAFAICAIVAFHYDWLHIGGGMTTVLFFLMGYSFAKYQLPAILQQDSTDTLKRTLKNVVITTIPITSAVFAAKILTGDPIHFSTLLFYTNFLDFNSTSDIEGGVIWLWFIACYVQMTAILIAVLSINKVKDFLRKDLGQGMFLLFGCAVIINSLLLFWGVPDLLSSGVEPLTMWNYLPTTHFPTMFLGGVVYIARKNLNHRLLALAAIVGFTWYLGTLFEHRLPSLFLVVAVSLVFMETFLLPSILRWTIMQISRASLYIYLLHGPILSVLLLLDLHITPWLLTILAISFATVSWTIWEKLLKAGQLLATREKAVTSCS